MAGGGAASSSEANAPAAYTTLPPTIVSSDGVPALLKQTNATLAALQGATTELARAAKYAPQIARNVAGGTDNLGGLLLQTQETARELELLLVQLRGVWILGGSNAPPPAPVPTRLPADEVRP